jgi:hypothetical protein
VYFFGLPNVAAGQRMFVVLGVAGRRPNDASAVQTTSVAWCEYPTSTAQTVATSADQGKTWTTTSLTGPSTARTDGQQAVGFADYVMGGPPPELPEVPLGLLLPATAIAVIGSTVYVRQRRVRRSPSL